MVRELKDLIYLSKLRSPKSKATLLPGSYSAQLLSPTLSVLWGAELGDRNGGKLEESKVKGYRARYQDQLCPLGRFLPPLNLSLLLHSLARQRREGRGEAKGIAKGHLVSPTTIWLGGPCCQGEYMPISPTSAFVTSLTSKESRSAFGGQASGRAVWPPDLPTNIGSGPLGGGWYID